MEQLLWWQVVLVVYIPYSLFPCIISVLNDCNGYDCFLSYTPKDLYFETKMNWFGCIFVWLLIVVINPMWWIIFELPIYIGRWIVDLFEWLFTIGRK